LAVGHEIGFDQYRNISSSRFLKICRIFFPDNFLAAVKLFFSYPTFLPRFFEQIFKKSIGVDVQNKKAHPIFWNRLLKDFSSVWPSLPHLL